MVGANCHGFTIRFVSRVAHVCEEHRHARDTRVYIGSGLCGNRNYMSYVCRCIIICWVETSSTAPFIGKGVKVYQEDMSRL
jgi:hypothetical protein